MRDDEATPPRDPATGIESEPEPDPAPDVVVFDIGEVVIDETRVWSIWAELTGVSPLTFAAVLGAAVVQGQSIRETFAHLVPNIDPDALEDEHERRYGGFGPEDVYPDVRPCLVELAAQGFRVILAGNQPRRRGPQLDGLDLPCELALTSEELGVAKPDIGFFTAVLARIGVEDPSRVLYVGDRVDNDVLAAGAAGMRTCWLRRGPWGVLQELPDDVEADLVLEGLGELPVLLTTWRG